MTVVEMEGGAARPSGWARVGLVAVVVTMLVVCHQLGVLSIFAEPVRVKAALLELGALGYLTFVVAYALLQPFGVPGTVFIFAAPLIWTWPVAFALSLVGTMAASVVGFSFARFVARDAVARRIPARFARYSDALERRGFATVFLLRFIFWMPPLLHAFFGVSKVRFSTHFWGSLVGYLVPLFLVSYFGERLVQVMLSAPPSAWLGVAIVTLAIVGIGVVWRRRGRQRASSGL